MYDIRIAVAQFENLVELAGQAESRFEKAAVFAATIALSERFVGEGEWNDGLIDVNPSYLAAVEDARYNLCAAVGYDRVSCNDIQTYLERASEIVGEMRRCMWSCGHRTTMGLRIRDDIAESEGFLRRGSEKSTFEKANAMRFQ